MLYISWRYDNITIGRLTIIITNMKILKYIGLGVLTILTVDFLMFLVWVWADQLPPTGIYVGRITTEILRLLIV